MTNEQKHWIDNADYETLLRHWRFAPPGDAMFQGATGEHYAKIMAERKATVGNAEHARTSKSIGW